MFAEGEEIAERTGDLATLALLQGGLGLAVATCAGDVPEYVERATEAARLGDRIDDPGSKVAAAVMPMYALYLAGRHEEALASLARVIELTEDDPHLGAGTVIGHPRAWATSFRAPPLIALGRFPEARRAIAEGTDLCQRFDRESLGWTHTFHCALATFGGEPAGPDAVAHGRQAVEIAEAIGDSFSRVVASAWLGFAHVAAGDASEGEAIFTDCLEAIKQRGAGRELEPSVRGGLGGALAAIGERDRAVEECELAIRLASERGVASVAPQLRRTLGEVLLVRGEPADIEVIDRRLREAETLARELRALPQVALSLAARARLFDRVGNVEARDRARADATSLARSMDARGLLADLEAEAASAPAWR